MGFLKLGLAQCAITLIATASSIPHHARATLVSRDDAAKTSYDFIVAGGGIAGLTVANRLTEDPSVNVLVIEAGPLDKGEDAVLIPGDDSFGTGPYLYSDIFSVPQPGLDNNTFEVLSGRVVGGGSVVNSMIWIRSSANEYDAWASTLGATGWDWNNLLPFFEKSENFTAPDPAFAKQANISFEANVHGTNGPIHVSYPNFFFNSSDNWWTAAQSVGIGVAADLNGGTNNQGLGWVPTAINPTTRTRSDARLGYYDPIASRPNYHLLTDTTVSKILFNGNKTTGVQYVSSNGGGSTQTANVKREVLVAGGGVKTPQLLQLSGIGPKSLLNSLKIPVVADLPGVGTNLQDTPHFGVPYTFSNNDQPDENDFLGNTTYQQEQQQVYQTQHTGPYVIPNFLGVSVADLPLCNMTSDCHSIISSAQNADAASLLPAGTDATVVAGYQKQRQIRLQQLGGADTTAAFFQWNEGPTVTIFLGTSLSRGSVNINTTDPLAPPVVDWRALSDPTDYQVVYAAFQKNRDVMNAPAMKALGPTEGAPFGSNVTDFNSARTALASVGVPSLAHECCTAPMMDKNLGGVVDPEMRVYGVQGLRVVDISTQPLLSTLPPQPPVYAMAERIASIIKQDYKLS